MSTAPNDLTSLVRDELGHELDEALRTIHHCIGQLTDDQCWWRPSDSMNSIANLTLHLSGNLRQWIISGVGGSADTRERQREFDERATTPRAGLLEKLESAVREARSVLSGVSDTELQRMRVVQGNNVSGLQAIVHSVAHFRGHTQEIVHMTRCQLGDAYEFDFIPSERDDSPDVADDR